MGSTNWLLNKPAVAKYVNKAAPTGGSAKVSVIKPGDLVKLVGKNLGDTPIDIFNQGAAATGVANTAYSSARVTTCWKMESAMRSLTMSFFFHWPWPWVA